MKTENINGVLPVYKEKGYTSNDVVAKLRGILKIKKIGHTGTLDPEAEGVLPVCIGRATKLISMLTDTDKTYRCVCRLGVTTDTEDMTGTVLTQSDISGISKEDIIKAVNGFRGEYKQIPPMYSAKKVNGRKLYELAREGIVIERKPCEVYINSIDIDEIDTERGSVAFTVSCSKGTYVRSLCRDIGEALGCGAAMESLIRTAACGFIEDESLTLTQIEEYSKKGEIGEHITGLETMFSDLPEIRLKPEEDRAVINGNILKVSRPDGKYRVYLSDGHFAAVYEIKKNRASLCGYFLT